MAESQSESPITRERLRANSRTVASITTAVSSHRSTDARAIISTVHASTTVPTVVSTQATHPTVETSELL